VTSNWTHSTGCLLVLSLMAALLLADVACSPKAPSVNGDAEPATGPDSAANWPYFRGPSCGGPAVNSGDVPSPLNLEHHKVFDVELPAGGASSPIIWGNRIYLTGEGGQVLAFDRTTGKPLWSAILEIPVPASVPATEGQENEWPEMDGDGSAGTAAPTPVTDGKFIYAFFGNGVLSCFDSSGKQVWAKRLVAGGPKNAYGYAASPLLYGDLVIQVIDRGCFDDKASFIIAVRAKDGTEAWRTLRPVGSCWATPLIVHIADGDVLVTTAPPLVIAYVPKTGRQLWQAKGSQNDELSISPVPCGEGMVAVAASRGLTAFKVAGKGDVTDSGGIWTSVRPPRIASPACGGGQCYLLDNETLTCVNASTGKKKWELDLEGDFWASPVLAKNRIYAINTAGVLFVASADGKKLDEVKLGDSVRASPAILDGRIYVRTAHRLLCVGRP